MCRIFATSAWSGVLCVAVACSEQNAPAPDPAARWVVSQDGAGDVRLGMSRTQLTARGGAINSASEACEYVVPQGAPPGVRVMVVNGTVRRIDISPPGVPTDEGVGVGSSEARIKAAYPSVISEAHKYTSGRNLIVELAASASGVRRLVFETGGGSVTRYRVGLMPEVGWVEGCG